MKKRSKIKIIKNRIAAGLFSVILLLMDVTSTGITVLAQESKLIGDTVTQQEVAGIENDATELPSDDEERAAGDTQIPDGEGGEDTPQNPGGEGSENTPQDPDGEGNGNESQDSDGEDNVNAPQGPDEWDIEKTPQSPDKEDGEDDERPAEGKSDAEEEVIDGEEDEIIDAYSDAEEQDIRDISDDVIAYGSYEENGSYTKWSIDTDGKLTVEGSGEFAAISSDIDRAPWHSDVDKIKTAEIDVSGMTDASGMLSGCVNLTSVDFSEFDTADVTNMSSMFYNCINLKNLDVSGFQTGNVTDLSGMFNGCKSLTVLDLNNFDVSAAENMSNMFNGCSNLETIYTPYHVNEDLSVKLPKAKSSDKWYSSVDGSELSELPRNQAVSILIQKNKIAGDSHNEDDYDITWSIDENGKLTVEGNGEFAAASSSADAVGAPWHDHAAKIKTAEIRVSGMTDATGMFKDCINLTSVDFSGFDTENVTSMSSMFCNCKNLKSLDLSGLDTHNVTDTAQMFNGCESLISINLRGFDTGSVTDMSYMFSGCFSLKSLDVSSFKTDNVTDMSYMFSDCASLTILNVSGFNHDVVENMSHMFSNCSCLKSLNVNGLDTDSVTDMSYMFAGCTGLTTLDVSSFKTGNVTDMSYMFSDCSSLKTLNISMLDTSSVRTVEGMFSSCNDLTSVNLSGLTNQHLVTMQNMFYNCKSLQSVYLDKFNTSNVTDMSNLFKGCSSLKTLNLDGLNVSGVRDLSGMFEGCGSLASLDLGSLDTGSVTSASNMFAGCSNLKILDLDGFNVSGVRDLSGMFEGCKSLATLDLSSFDVGAAENMSNMFNGCSSLISLDLSGFNVGNVTSMDNMLNGCSNLMIIYTPCNVKASAVLPKAKSSDKWYNVDGTILTELPRNDDSNISILIEKNKKVIAYGSYEENGSDTKWLIDADGKLTVEGKGEFAGESYDMDTPRAPWLQNDNATKIKTAEIRVSGMTDASGMFNGCTKLTKVDLSGFDTGSVTNMSYMFAGCTGLTSLDVSGFNSGNVENMSNMFFNCSSLKSLNVNGFNTDNVANMSYMFYNCKSLTSLDVSSFNTRNVTDVSFMFSDCINLKTLDTSMFDTSNIEKMGSMFNGCRVLQSVDLSGFQTDKVTDMGSMFNGCSSLKTLDLSSFDAGSLTRAGNMFAGCSSLKTLNLDGFNVRSVTDLSGMFNGCKSLTTLDLGSFNVSRVTDLSNMFNGCSNLVSLDLSGFDVGNVTSMEKMANLFNGCGKLATIYTPCKVNVSVALPSGKWYSAGDADGTTPLTELPQDSVLLLKNKKVIAYGNFDKNGSDTKWFIDADGKLTVEGKGEFADVSFDIDRAPWHKDAAKIKTADIRVSGMTDATGMFKDCTNLTKVDLSGFDTGSVTDMPYMFAGCTGLKSLDVSGFDTGNATDMSHMFENCKSLTGLDMSKFSISKVTDISYMFSDCASLKTLDISMFDTAKVENMESLFRGCKALQSVDLGGFQTANVTDMGDLFNGCSSLKTLDLSSFETDKLTNASNLFSGCSNLKTLNLGKFDVGGVTDLRGMFYGCKSLTALDLSRFDVSAAENMDNMFNGCSGLTSLDLSGFDVSAAKEMNDMFTGCSKLTTFYTPCNVNETLSVELPVAKSSDKWYNADGIILPELPKSLDHSILLQKNKAPSVKAAELKVAKETTAYECFSEVNLDDLKVTYYDVLGNVYTIPQNLEGTEGSEGYSVDLEEVDVNTPGSKTLKVSYKELTTEVGLTFTYVMTSGNITIVMPQDVIYSGYPKVPAPIVTRTVDKAILVPGRDYTVSYINNVNAGDEAEITVVGRNDYSGEVTALFSINPAELIIQAEDITLGVGDGLPAEFPYEAIGLSLGDEDQLEVTGYSYTDRNHHSIDKKDIDGIGIYYVKVEVNPGANYIVDESGSREGKLTIAEERIGYTVTFDMSGHGTEVEIPGIKACSLLDIDELNEQLVIDIPRERDGELVTDESGRYVFAGWYKDKTFATKQKWNFVTDIVQADTTLYACWIEKPAVEGGAPLLSLSIQDIQAQSYTGSAIKPTVYIYSADGKTLLTSGRDYTISYANNTNAVQKESGKLPAIGTALVTNPGKKNEEIENISGSFSKDYPYIIITGKGNYSETIYKNFYILPAEIASEDGTGNMVPAEGITLKYSDQLVTNAKNDQNPFSSLKYKAAMALGKDYMITLKAEADVKCDESVVLEQGVDPSKWSAETVYVEKTRKYTAPVIPKGYYGTFTMTVEGVGNYTGAFKKTVVVTDKNHLVKNVSVTLGKNQKSLAYQDGKALTLQPGYSETVTVDKKKQTLYYSVEKDGAKNLVSNTNDIFLIKAGSEYLVYGKDYSVSYTDNHKVGTATMTITGMGDYMGTKSVTFKITGTAFNTASVVVKTYDAKNPEETVGCFMPSIIYTGTDITQNSVILTPKATAANQDPDPLVYGMHYTVSYKNNIKKGTATATFTARPESGYTGSFSKTFKIVAQNLTDDMFYKGIIEFIKSGDSQVTQLKLKETLPYVRGGVKVADWIEMNTFLTNGEGIHLAMGTDFAVTYKNNTAVNVNIPDLPDSRKPYMIFTGKGNYAGTLTVYFDIGKAKISKDDVTVSQIAWNQKAKDAYEYKPGVKVVDGVSGKVLSAGAKQDYIITYENNGQTNVTRHVLGEEGSVLPAVVITVPETSSYELADNDAVLENGEFIIKVPLPIYKTKLTSSNLYIIIDAEQTIYTGEQLKPDVEVYYGDTAAVNKARKDKMEDGKTLTDANGNYKLRKLSEKTDPSAENGEYTLSYGANIAAGTNTGSVTVAGDSKEFGGSVTVKFNIIKKGIAIIVRVTSFELDKAEIKGSVGETDHLTAYIKPTYATCNTIEWESADPQIAEVVSVDYESDNEARVSISLKKEGMTVIKAYTDQRRVAAKCLVFINSDSDAEVTGFGGRYLTPQMYMTGGRDDYTSAFNKAAEYIEESRGHYKTLYVPAGTYKIDAAAGIQMKGNMNLEMSPKTVLEAISNGKESYDIININYTGDIKISGGKIVGDRGSHKGTSGEWGMGIGIYHGWNITITGVDISECWGDGIYLGSVNENNPDMGCNNITITDCNLHDNRRNNLSIVCADYVSIDNCKFDRANGTSPEYGIDIETNNPQNPCEHIEIKNSTFSGNGQGSMGIVTAANDVRITGCTLNGIFINYAGKDVRISNSVLNGKVYARMGVSLVDGAKINDGGSEEDLLIASFDAEECPYPFNADTCPYTISKYGDDNISFNVAEDGSSSSGKALQLKRNAAGRKEAGYCLDLKELTGGIPSLKKGVIYRFEYHVRGSGQWGIKTDQTSWYPCVPVTDKYSTGIVTYEAGSEKPCKLYLYAVDKTNGMELMVDYIKIYEVR